MKIPHKLNQQGPEDQRVQRALHFSLLLPNLKKMQRFSSMKIWQPPGA